MVMRFGKYKGCQVTDLPSSYLAFLLDIDLHDPHLRLEVLTEWCRRHPESEGADEESGLTIRLKRNELPLAREVWDAGHRALAKRWHPDRGGSDSKMAEL